MADEIKQLPGRPYLRIADDHAILKPYTIEEMEDISTFFQRFSSHYFYWEGSQAIRKVLLMRISFLRERLLGLIFK